MRKRYCAKHGSGSSFISVFLLFTGLSPGLTMSEDYGNSKSSGTVPHQSLPAFSSQPFGSRSNFRYSPPYSTQQTGTPGGAADAASWTYASPTNDQLTTQYGTPSRRQTVNPVTTPTQHQLNTAASLSTRECSLQFSVLITRQRLGFSSYDFSVRPRDLPEKSVDWRRIAR